MLWLTGLQVHTANGSTAEYIAKSDSYLTFYAAALRSARENAPGLLPVLVALNEWPANFVRWAEAQGALVLPHKLSFAGRMAASRNNLHAHLMASFARLDVPAIMTQVGAAGRGWRQGVAQA